MPSGSWRMKTSKTEIANVFSDGLVSGLIVRESPKMMSEFVGTKQIAKPPHTDSQRHE
jgi:hypothetical protein